MQISCPLCKTNIGKPDSKLLSLQNCTNCGFEIKLLHGVPILRPYKESEELDILNEAKSLPIQDSSTLKIPFVQEALDSNKDVLQLGAGVDKCNLPHLIKTDAYLYSTDLHSLVDAHLMPFPDDSFDYVYSLAVFEHLHSPWIAAEEIFRVLKPGGKVFVLTAFMQHMHGYPNHYFNMTTSGAKRIFSQFNISKCQPSSWSNFDQLAYILGDLNCLLDELKITRKEKKSLRCLKNGISKVFEYLPKFNSKLLQCDTRSNGPWEKIAPAIELEASKPL
ncbi:class I SAM-dependent methyltransferase [Opitutales bacterium]|nr:class I SAM-dependent methyltransferase [Opitutales bacterium]